jgi:flagellar motor protein MotB
MGRIVTGVMTLSVALLLSTAALAQTTEKTAPAAVPADKVPAKGDKKAPAKDDKKPPATVEKKDVAEPPKPATEAAPAEPATPKPAKTDAATGEAEKAPAEETPSEKDIAANFYREAQKLFAQELYLAALSAYKKSYKFYKTPVTLYNMAKCHEKLGDSKNCIDGYESYIKDYKEAKGTMPPDIGDIKNAIAKCRLGLRLEITIESDPPGAAVYIDDPQKMVGQTPMKTAVDPGTYTLFVRAKGRVELKRQMIVQQGEPLKLFFKLEEIARAGTVRIDCNIAGASIFHNGKNIGRTPLRAELVIKEGKHQFAIEKDEYQGHNQTLEVKAEGKYIVEADLFLKDPPPTWKGPVGWSSLIIGALLIGGGYGSGYYADTLFQKTDDFKLYSMLQQVGYGAGGGLAGIGLVLIIWEAAGGNVIKEKDAISALDGSKSYSLQPFVRVGSQGGILGADFRF